MIQWKMKNLLKSKSLALALTVLATPVSAECVLKQDTEANVAGTIESVKNVNKTVTAWKGNKQKCIVDFDAKIDGKWHIGSGSYIFSNNESVGKSCAVAFTTGKKLLLERLYPQTLESHDVLVCNDGKDGKPKTGLEGLTPIGRPAFAYEGKRCGWFYETVQEGTSLYQYTVIACEMRPDRWNIMDRF